SATRCALRRCGVRPVFTHRSMVFGSVPTVSARVRVVSPAAAIAVRSRSLGGIGTFYVTQDMPWGGLCGVPPSLCDHKAGKHREHRPLMQNRRQAPTDERPRDADQVSGGTATSYRGADDMADPGPLGGVMVAPQTLSDSDDLKQ